MLRRDKTGGPVITLDYKVNQVVIGDIVAGCVACVVAPLASFLGVVVVHSMTVTWGPEGTMTYNAANVKVGESASSSLLSSLTLLPQQTPTVPLISYSATHDMGSSASLKVGSSPFRLETFKIYIFVDSLACTVSWFRPRLPRCELQPDNHMLAHRGLTPAPLQWLRGKLFVFSCTFTPYCSSPRTCLADAATRLA